MMTTALLTLMMGTNLAGTGDITCEFPPEDASGSHLSVALRPAPSLRDRPGFFRAKLSVGNREALQATLKPIENTEARDMGLTAKGTDNLVYAMGLLDDGQAALNIRLLGSQASETRFGTCQGIDGHMNHWLPK